MKPRGGYKSRRQLNAEDQQKLAEVFEGMVAFFDEFDAWIGNVEGGKVPTPDELATLKATATRAREQHAIVAGLLAQMLS